MVSMRYINKLLLTQLFLLSSTACADTSGENNKTVKSAATQYLKVIGVAADDTLNLREAAAGKSKTVYKLAHNANGMLKLGDSNGWVKLSYKEHVGWAYGKYLQSTIAPGVMPEISNELFCLGTEPHWILKTDNNKLKYKKYDDQAEYLFNSSFEKNIKEMGVWTFSATNPEVPASSISIVIKHNEQCSDEMSDDKYTYSIKVNDKEMGVLNGCCNKRM